MTSTYSPPPFLLAQEVHFTVGFAVVAAAALKGLAYYGVAAILLVDLAKELTFDRGWPPNFWPQGGEDQPFFPRPPAGYRNSGLVDWLFYLAGVAFALAWLFLVP